MYDVWGNVRVCICVCRLVRMHIREKDTKEGINEVNISDKKERRKKSRTKTIKATKKEWMIITVFSYLIK
jgi:hypothetical protein